MVNETIIPEDFCNCLTKIQCREFMKTFNNLNPLLYFELSLTKIPDLLSPEQKIDLKDYIDDPDYRRGWDIYCNILTVEQIQIEVLESKILLRRPNLT